MPIYQIITPPPHISIKYLRIMTYNILKYQPITLPLQLTEADRRGFTRLDLDAVVGKRIIEHPLLHLPIIVTLTPIMKLSRYLAFFILAVAVLSSCNSDKEDDPNLKPTPGIEDTVGDLDFNLDIPGESGAGTPSSPVRVESYKDFELTLYQKAATRIQTGRCSHVSRRQ